MTPGTRTSEFYLTVLVVVALLVLALEGDLPSDTAAQTITGAVAAYGVSRGLAKRQ